MAKGLRMSSPLPDWRLPPGVNRGLWDYLHNPAIARDYDAGLAGSPIFAEDQAFVAKHCAWPGRLLDLGCGTGRLLVDFGQRGYLAVGVDLSPEMLAVAQERTRDWKEQVFLLCANITQLDCLADATFDYAACLFSTLGMVIGSEQREWVVHHVRRVLRPGGRFVLHVHNRWFNARDRAGRRWLVKNVLREKSSGDRPMHAHEGSACLTLHHFTRREAVQLLAKAGLRLIEVQPIGIRPGVLPWPRCLGWLRAYGYLLAAERP
jgi:SAM-dependent methyltransferase